MVLLDPPSAPTPPTNRHGAGRAAAADLAAPCLCACWASLLAYSYVGYGHCLTSHVLNLLDMPCGAHDDIKHSLLLATVDPTQPGQAGVPGGLGHTHDTKCNGAACHAYCHSSALYTSTVTNLPPYIMRRYEARPMLRPNCSESVRHRAWCTHQPDASGTQEYYLLSAHLSP